MSEDFSLRSLIREVLSENDSLADPTDVTAVVVDRIKDEQLWDALTETLRPYVHGIMVQERQHRSSVTTATSRASGRPRGVSTKWAEVRDGWQKRLKDREYIPNAGWKILAECTYSDLTGIADFRRTEAERHLASERWYRNIATLISEHDVTHVRELPPEVLATALS